MRQSSGGKVDSSRDCFPMTLAKRVLAIFQVDIAAYFAQCRNCQHGKGDVNFVVSHF